MFFEKHFFFNFGAFDIFYTSKNLVFGFTSSKSYLLPLIFNALELQKTFLVNVQRKENPNIG